MTAASIYNGLKQFAPAAATIGSSLIQANAAGDAAKLQAEATQKALDEEKRQYDLYRSDTAPYREGGYEALDLLIPGTSSRADARSAAQAATTQPSTPPPGTPAVQAATAAPPMTLQTLNTPAAATGQMVTLRAPNGQTRAVPREQADHYVRLGATVVG